MSAFFMPTIAIVLTIQTTPAFADNCFSQKLSKPEKVTVKWIYDGDTLLLTDKRKIRIIGIDTPETKHHKQKAEAYGAKAREALRELLKKCQYQIELRYGKEKQDKYKRTLAHVYLPDGTNISNWLLERGYAKALAFPPNTVLADCYRKAERYAQSRSLKIWKFKKNKIKEANSLPTRTKGVIRLKGHVKQVYSYRKSTIIELESNSKQHIQLKIKKKNLSYFKHFDFEALNNNDIIVSGYLKNKRNKRTLYLNHPSQIEIIQRKRFKPKNLVPHSEATIKWS